jgi:hypothetical protein
MKDEFKGKTIILGVPNHFGLPERFKENLEFLGFQVYLIEHPSKSPKIAIIDSIIHNFKKFFKKDRSYKSSRISILKEAYHLNQLEKLNTKTDYVLIIRPDLYSIKVIKEIIKKSNFSGAYQWDGIDRFPSVKNYVALFDKFYVFDERDAQHYENCYHTTNFYFDDLLEVQTNLKYDVFFVGTFMKNRFHQLIILLEFFRKKLMKNSITISIKKAKKERAILKNLGVNITNRGISFKENLLLLKQSKIVLDFKNNIHDGLSFRTFESLGYQKKLITNNTLVKSFDFYNPANIYLIENENLDGLDVFLNTPYQPVNKDILTKYSFTNWLKNVLQIEPQNKITIPYGTKD